MTRQDDKNATEDVRQLDDSPASPLEPTAVRAAEQADADKDLPNADTDTKQADKAAKGRSSN